MDRMRHRAGAMLGALAVALLASGCTPEPTPTPSPTGFASEEEAFAAAEATYRAYVDAVNARRADPTSEPDPTDLLTASAYNDHVETQRALEERDWRIEGATSIASVEHLSTTSDTIELSACIDASQTRVLDSVGNDVTPPDRDERLIVNVTVTSGPTVLAISRSIAVDSEC